MNGRPTFLLEQSLPLLIVKHFSEQGVLVRERTGVPSTDEAGPSFIR
jgi:hypothetical protein